MNDERQETMKWSYTYVRTVFLQALEIQDAQQQEAFLVSACKSNSALRAQVEELLQANVAGARFLRAEPRSGGRESNPPDVLWTIPAVEKPGDRIGRYRLLERIGEGGCAIVYKAEQEEPVRRKVALKIIKLGMDTKSMVDRFEAERQALAIMEHPNIARVIDAGSTGTGRPYFVMELVCGIKITEYCDQQKCTTKERLELFIQVCPGRPVRGWYRSACP